MKHTAAPRLGAWFLTHYGSRSITESEIGDLTEQMQRGRGAMWYWRQVLSMVFADLVGDLRHSGLRVLPGLGMGWLVWLVLQLLGGWLLMLRHVLARPDQHSFSSTVNLFPFVTLRWGADGFPETWDVSLLALVLNLATLWTVGVLLTSGRRLPPQTMVLTFTLSYVVFTLMAIIATLLNFDSPYTAQFLLQEVFALAAAPPLLLWGGAFRRPVSL